MPLALATVVLTLFWLCHETGHAQGIIHVQMPPSPSMGMVQDADTGEWIDPLASYTQGLRLLGENWDLVINGQTVLTFSSGDSFSVTATGSNSIIGTWTASPIPTIPALAATNVTALTAGQIIDRDAAGYGWLPGGLLASSKVIFLVSLFSSVSPNEFAYMTSGEFAGLESGYVGFEFYQDGNPYYGWINVGNINFLNASWIYEYAYSTIPNMPIFAGQVPEPSTWALLGLGGLTFFILCRKWQFP